MKPSVAWISLFYLGYLRNKTRPTVFLRKLDQSISICIPRTKLEPQIKFKNNLAYLA